MRRGELRKLDLGLIDTKITTAASMRELWGAVWQGNAATLEELEISGYGWEGQASDYIYSPSFSAANCIKLIRCPRTSMHCTITAPSPRTTNEAAPTP